MKKSPRIALALAATLLCTLVLSACASGQPASTPPASAPASQAAGSASTQQPDSSTQPAPAGALTFSDMAGREVTLQGPATRVVVLTPSDCEILHAIGAGDTLVARGPWCNYPAEVLGLPVVETGDDLNVEQVLALEPQVVVMPVMNQSVEQVGALADAGVQVVVSNAQGIAGTYTAIALMGTLSGKTAEADALIAQMQADFAEVEAGATGDGSQTVYFEVSPLEYGLWTTGANTFMDELATMVGLTNAFADVDGWGQISQEQVIQRAPDFIVTVTMYAGEGPTPEEEIMARPGWERIPAVQNGAIFNANNDEISRPGPRLVAAARALAAFVAGAQGQAAAA